MTSYLPGLEPTPAPEFQPPDRTPSSVRSAHTRRNYARAVRAFQAWCSERGVPAMPSSPNHISRYLHDPPADFRPGASLGNPRCRPAEGAGGRRGHIGHALRAAPPIRGGRADMEGCDGRPRWNRPDPHASFQGRCQGAGYPYQRGIRRGSPGHPARQRGRVRPGFPVVAESNRQAGPSRLYRRQSRRWLRRGELPSRHGE